MSGVTYCRACGRGPLHPKWDTTVPTRMRHYGRGLDGSCYGRARYLMVHADYAPVRNTHHHSNPVAAMDHGYMLDRHCSGDDAMNLATLAPPEQAPPCTDAHVDEFFRRPGEPLAMTRTRLTETARAYCAHCPIRDACADTAAQLRAEGLWAGVLRRRHHGGGITTRNLLDDTGDE